MIHAMQNKVILLLIANLISLYSVCQMKEASQWDKYIKPIIDSLSQEENKTVFISQEIPIIVRNQEKYVDSILMNNYQIGENEWNCIYDSWALNRVIPKEWEQSISKRKKEKLFKKWNYEKDLMLSITFPLFIKPDIYVVQITSRCPGKCSSSYLYFMEFDQKSKKVTVRHKYEASYS